MAFRHTVVRAIPWSGCSPAEPASVSPGKASVPHGGVRASQNDQATAGTNDDRSESVVVAGKIKEDSAWLQTVWSLRFSA
jgi:hypothetical protein